MQVMAIFNKKDMTLMAYATRVHVLICYAPLLLAFYLPFAPGFSPSPIINNISNWLGLGLGILFFVSLVNFFFFGNYIKRKDRQKVDRRVFLILIPILVPFLTIMNTGLFKVVIGEFVHNSSDGTKCYFSREITKEIQGVRIKRPTLNIDRNENAKFSWNITRQEYKILPEKFMANIYASQSNYGLKIEGYTLMDNSNSPPIDPRYKTYCDASWFLNPPRRSHPLFYWY